MRVSAVEMQRAHDLGKPIDDVLGAGLHNNVELQAEGRAIAERLSEESDVREDIVASLRERIEAGTYNVTGAEIADMIFRRAVADRIRSYRRLETRGAPYRVLFAIWNAALWQHRHLRLVQRWDGSLK